VGLLERDFERDHLAEKSNRTKMGQKIHCALGRDAQIAILQGQVSIYLLSLALKLKFPFLQTQWSASYSFKPGQFLCSFYDVHVNNSQLMI
jgi:hypothetical protein